MNTNFNNIYRSLNESPFTKSDYNSGDGMMTTVWGPPMWHILHTISFNYPIKPTPEDKKNYYNYFKNLKNILPCKYCRDNLENNLKKHKLTKNTMKNRDVLSRWVYDLHEIVNRMLEKKSNLTYEQVRDRYEHFRSRCILDPSEVTKIHLSKEKGCTEPLYGVKSKCVINIIPKDDKHSKNNESFIIDNKCILSKGKKCTKKRSSKKN
jgi:hypothetical protein